MLAGRWPAADRCKMVATINGLLEKREAEDGGEEDADRIVECRSEATCEKREADSAGI